MLNTHSGEVNVPPVPVNHSPQTAASIPADKQLRMSFKDLADATHVFSFPSLISMKIIAYDPHAGEMCNLPQQSTLPCPCSEKSHSQYSLDLYGIWADTDKHETVLAPRIKNPDKRDGTSHQTARKSLHSGERKAQ